MSKARVSRKRPWVAAILAVVFGPLGLIYLGWRYALTFLIAVGAFLAFTSSGMGFGTATWVRYVTLLLIAYKAFILAKTRNEALENDDDILLRASMSFPIAVVASTDLFVGLATVYTGISIAVIGLDSLLAGAFLRGLVIVLLGVPVLTFLIHLFLGMLTGIIDAIALRALERQTANAAI